MMFLSNFIDQIAVFLLWFIGVIKAIKSKLYQLCLNHSNRSHKKGLVTVTVNKAFSQQ
jgi:hypothetical protein